METKEQSAQYRESFSTDEIIASAQQAMAERDTLRAENELLRSGAVRAQTDRRQALGMDPRPNQCPHCLVDAASLRAEVERLREHLKQMISDAEQMNDPSDKENGTAQYIQRNILKARAALAKAAP